MATLKWKVFDPHLQRNVTIHLLRSSQHTDPECSQRFHREARILAGFQHPNIAQVYDISPHIDDRDVAYMVTPSVQGTTGAYACCGNGKEVLRLAVSG